MMTRIRQQPRRASLFALLILCLLVAALVSRASEKAHATSGGSSYDIPLVTDTNPAANIVETTLTADETTVDIGNGVTAHAQTFNGAIPGPTFKLNVGDTVIVHFKNDMSTVTGVHWHGIELENTMDGTPFTQDEVPPGDTFLYKFKVSRPGIFWYHPHHHSSTNQVFKGLYGMIIVRDPNEDALPAGTLPSAADTRPIVLSDTTVCKAPASGGDPSQNDTDTYDITPPTAPWVNGPDLPTQSPEFPPIDICENFPVNENQMPAAGPFADHDIPNVQQAGASRTNEGQTVLTNGKNVGGRAGSPHSFGPPIGALAAGAQTLDVQAGQGLRLQVLDAAQVRYFRLRLTDSAGTEIPLVRIGGEGGLLDHAVVEGNTLPVPAGTFDTGYEHGEIVLAPGSRADVVAAIPPTATGVLTLWTEDYARTGMGFSNIPTVPVMHLNITGPAASTYTIADGAPLASLGTPVQVIGPPTGTLLDPMAFSPVKLGKSEQNIQLHATGGGVDIDGTVGPHDLPPPYNSAMHIGSSRYAKLGDTLELTTENTSGAHHPWHLHGFSMQPISLTKAGDPSFIWPYHEFRDNIDIPGHYTLTYRIKLDDRALADGVTPGGGLGRWLFHCHIFFHATLGMLGELVVTAPNGNEKPDVNANDTDTAEVAPHTTATMDGTFADPDGDPVTLTASLGTVTTPGAPGTWHWENTDATTSGFVYITATDSNGLKDQAVFKQRVTNLPPVADADGPYATIEGTGVALNASASTDPNGDALTYEWDLDNDTQFDDATGATPLATFGDDGSFTISLKVTDPDGAFDTDSSTVTVSNVAPTATIDESSAVLINGIPTIIGHSGVPLSFSGRTQDPGSDDLLATWHWGDGTPNTATLYLNDVNFIPDPDPSPTINPRDVTDTQSHTFGDFCLYSSTFSSGDDDSGVSPTDTVNVIIGGNALGPMKSDQWRAEFDRGDHPQFTIAQLNCFLAIAAYSSNVFNETRDASTIAAALVVLRHKEPAFMSTELRELDQELLAAWLNFANGGLSLAQLVDTDNNGIPDTPFATVMTNSETIRNDPTSTKILLKMTRSLLQKVNDGKA